MGIEISKSPYVKIVTNRMNIRVSELVALKIIFGVNFPYQFTFKTHYNFKFALNNINIALENDFKESNLFREKYCSGYDTFFAYIYDDNLIVGKFDNNYKFNMVDCIYLFKSKTYSELDDYLL